MPPRNLNHQTWFSPHGFLIAWAVAVLALVALVVSRDAVSGVVTGAVVTLTVTYTALYALLYAATYLTVLVVADPPPEPWEPAEPPVEVDGRG